MTTRRPRRRSARSTPPASSRTCASRSRTTCWSSSCRSARPSPRSNSPARRNSTRTTLQKALREIGLAEGRIFDSALLDRAEQELKRQYLSRGLLRARRSDHRDAARAQPRRRSTSTIDEGEVAKIRQINIVGNQAFSEEELLRPVHAAHAGLAHLVHQGRPVLASRSWPPTWRRCARTTSNRGYLEFNIESTQVSITPDSKDIYITVAITEGARYTVSATSSCRGRAARAGSGARAS